MQLNISLYSHILVRKQFKAEKKTVRYKTKLIKTTESLQTALALLNLFIENLVDPLSEAAQASSTEVMLNSTLDYKDLLMSHLSCAALVVRS